MSGDRYKMSFRLAPDDWKRLEKACAYRHQGKQAFVEQAVFAEIAEVEDRRRGGKLLREEYSTDKRVDDKPKGLDLANRLKPRPQEAAQQEEAPAEKNAPHVTVNVGAHAHGNKDDIDRLASYVSSTTGEIEREARLRTAVNILRATASSEEERQALAARLDEAVAAKLQARADTSATASGGMVRKARIAFDKLTGLLRTP